MEVIVDNVKANVWTFDDQEDDPIHTIARGVEADVNAEGWGGSARLGYIIEHEVTSNDGQKTGTMYAACELPMFEEFYENPAAGLHQWNMTLLGDMNAVGHMLGILEPIQSKFVGWVFTSETWFYPGGVRPESEQDQESLRKESRVCIVSLDDGRVVQVSRIRNLEGSLDQMELLDSNGDGTPGGFVVWNLMTLTNLSKQFIKMLEGGVRGTF